MTFDYCITWAYIVSRMKSKYGFSPDNEERLSFGELEAYLGDIWSEYYDVLRSTENDEKMEEVTE